MKATTEPGTGEVIVSVDLSSVGGRLLTASAQRVVIWWINPEAWDRAFQGLSPRHAARPGGRPDPEVSIMETWYGGEYCTSLASRGHYAFTTAQAQSALGVSDVAVQGALRRLKPPASGLPRSARSQVGVRALRGPSAPGRAGADRGTQVDELNEIDVLARSAAAIPA